MEKETRRKCEELPERGCKIYIGRFLHLNEKTLSRCPMHRSNESSRYVLSLQTRSEIKPSDAQGVGAVGGGGENGELGKRRREACPSRRWSCSIHLGQMGAEVLHWKEQTPTSFLTLCGHRTQFFPGEGLTVRKRKSRSLSSSSLLVACCECLWGGVQGIGG